MLLSSRTAMRCGPRITMRSPARYARSKARTADVAEDAASRTSEPAILIPSLSSTEMRSGPLPPLRALGVSLPEAAGIPELNAHKLTAANAVQTTRANCLGTASIILPGYSPTSTWPAPACVPTASCDSSNSLWQISCPVTERAGAGFFQVAICYKACVSATCKARAFSNRSMTTHGGLHGKRPPKTLTQLLNGLGDEAVEAVCHGDHGH